MKFIPYGRQYIDEDDINAVVEVLRSDWLTQGPKVKEFEDAVSAYHDCKYAVAFCNGTAALHGAYHASGMEQGDEFITSPITFVATTNAGIYCGGTPKFIDIDMATYCIDIDQIEDAITGKTRVVTPVSYAGYPADIKAIKNLPKVQQGNICIIHDACHAIGAIREGHGIADFSDMTVLSFHPVKHIACGEGGMVLTNNEEYYRKLLLFRNHGITKDQNCFLSENDGPWHYEMQELGYNYRLTDIQSALGISQMKKLDRSIKRRNEISKIYKEELKDIEWITLPPGFEEGEHIWDKEGLNSFKNIHAYHLYPILLDEVIDRKDFFSYMNSNNIGVQVHYIPVFQHPYYKNDDYLLNSKFKNSTSFFKREVSVPMHLMDDHSTYYVIEKIIKYMRK